MEDDLNILENGRRLLNLANGRRLQYFGKWKTTSISWLMEDDDDDDDDDDGDDDDDDDDDDDNDDNDDKDNINF